MAEKVAKLGVGREKDFMYYVKDGGVWKVQRKQPGVPKGRPEKVADGGFEMDTNYIYFVDRDGDVARAKRAVGGQKRKKKSGRAAAKKRRAAEGRPQEQKKAAKKKAAEEEGRRQEEARQEEGQEEGPPLVRPFSSVRSMKRPPAFSAGGLFHLGDARALAYLRPRPLPARRRLLAAAAPRASAAATIDRGSRPPLRRDHAAGLGLAQRAASSGSRTGT